jgi:hypothetical protein
VSQTKKIERDLYPLKEARQLLGGVSPASIYRWASQGRIKLTRLGGSTFISAEEIARLAREGFENKAA